LSPKALASTLPAAPLTHEWPEGYSGWFGVISSEVRKAFRIDLKMKL
jgi:hypothetical protein